LQKFTRILIRPEEEQEQWMTALLGGVAYRATRNLVAFHVQGERLLKLGRRKMAEIFLRLVRLISVGQRHIECGCIPQVSFEQVTVRSEPNDSVLGSSRKAETGVILAIRLVSTVFSR